MKTDKTYYQVLEIDPEASADEIKSAYKRLARTYHPDLNPQRPRSAEDRFKRLQQAYSVLSDPVSRQQYDQSIGISQTKIVEETSYEDPQSPLIVFTEKPGWTSVFSEFGGRRIAALIVWGLCFLGTLLPTNYAAFYFAGGRLNALLWITIPLVMIWIGTGLSDNDNLDMSVGPMLKQGLGMFLEFVAWIYFARLIGLMLLGPLILLFS